MFCTKCGTQLSDDAAFCSNCGAQLARRAAAPAANNPAPAGAAAQTYAAAPESSGAPAANYPTANNPAHVGAAAQANSAQAAQAPASSAQGYSAPPSQAQPSPVPPSQAQAKKKWPIVVGVLVVVAIAVAVALFMLTRPVSVPYGSTDAVNVNKSTTLQFDTPETASGSCSLIVTNSEGVTSIVEFVSDILPEALGLTAGDNRVLLYDRVNGTTYAFPTITYTESDTSGGLSNTLTFEVDAAAPAASETDGMQVMVAAQYEVALESTLAEYGSPSVSLSIPSFSYISPTGTGVLSADLVDLNNDGTQELLVMYGKDGGFEQYDYRTYFVQIYSLNKETGLVEKAYEAQMGSPVQQISRHFRLYTASDGTYRISTLERGKDGNTTTMTTIYAGIDAQGKAFVDKTFKETAAPANDGSYTTSVDGNAVSESEYSNAYQAYVKSLTEVTCWSIDMPSSSNGKSRGYDALPAYLVKTIDSLNKGIASSMGSAVIPEVDKGLAATATHAANLGAAYNLYNSKTDPGGTTHEVIKYSSMSENTAATYDVDGDGYEEFMYCWTSTYTQAYISEIYQFDLSSMSWRLEYRGGATCTYYDNGTIRNGSSHNQTYGNLWPYNAVRYTPSTDAYDEKLYSAYSWSKSLHAQDYPADADTDNYGEVYVVTKTDQAAITMSKSAFDALEAETFGTKLDVPFQKLTSDGLRAL